MEHLEGVSKLKTKPQPQKRRNRFHCPHCKNGKSFINQKRLDRHLATIHNSTKRIACEVCQVVLKSEKFYKRHLLARHPATPRLYTCDYDGRTFTLKDYLRVHLDRHMKHQIYTCQICLKNYVSRHTFRRHLKMHIEKHVCNECGQTFGTKVNLDSHVASKHTEEQKVPCNYCTRLFCSKTARNNHQYISHKNKEELSFKCQQCNIYFEMKEELRIHSFIHFDGEIKTCPECDQIFKTTRLLNIHLHKHQERKSFQCTECGDFFTFKTGLAKHNRLNRCRGPPEIFPTINCNSEGDRKLVAITEDVARNQLASISRHKKSKKSEKRLEVVELKDQSQLKTLERRLEIRKIQEFKCEPTEVKVDEKAGIIVEQSTKETRKTRKETFVVNFRSGRAHLLYTCDICGQEVKYMKGIKNHMKTHVSQDRLQCKICSEATFKSRKTLSEHMLNVHDIKTSVLLEKFTCEVCGGKFDTKSRFEGHKLSHDENARILNCSMCSAAFKTIGNLRRHEATHAESKDFHCQKCSKSFKTKIALNVHMKNVHIEFNVLVECPICHAFVKEKNFNNHTKQQHSEDSNVKPFSCAICAKTFKTQKLGLRHYEDVHEPKNKGVVYSCPDCPEKFFRLRHLKDHSFMHFSGPISQCKTCEKLFKNARLLRIHERTHKNADTTLACGLCSSVLKTRSGLVKHVKSRHPEKIGMIDYDKVELNS